MVERLLWEQEVAGSNPVIPIGALTPRRHDRRRPFRIFHGGKHDAVDDDAAAAREFQDAPALGLTAQRFVDRRLDLTVGEFFSFAARASAYRVVWSAVYTTLDVGSPGLPRGDRVAASFSPSSGDQPEGPAYVAPAVAAPVPARKNAKSAMG